MSVFINSEIGTFLKFRVLVIIEFFRANTLQNLTINTINIFTNRTLRNKISFFLSRSKKSLFCFLFFSHNPPATFSNYNYISFNGIINNKLQHLPSVVSSQKIKGIALDAFSGCGGKTRTYHRAGFACLNSCGAQNLIA